MLIIPAGQSSMATPAYVIRNPEQVVNKFTITEEEKAAEALELWHHEKVTELKAFLKGYDMTAISTDELKEVGSRLFESGAINSSAFRMFIQGSGASDSKGHQTDTHVKFNAIALFNERLEDQIKFFENNPRIARGDGATEYLQGMVKSNHVINALAYFVNSSGNELSIDESA